MTERSARLRATRRIVAGRGHSEVEMEINKMKTVLSVAAVFAAAGAAQAAFEFASVDFGSAAGTPIVASADYVQHSAQAGLSNPDFGFTGTNNNFDGMSGGSFLGSGLWNSPNGVNVTIDEIAPGLFTEQVTGVAPDLAANTAGGPDIIIGNTLSGGWLNAPPFVQSGDNGLQGDDMGFGSMLIARLSVPAGETIDFASASGLVTLSLDGGMTPATAGGSNGLSFINGAPQVFSDASGNTALIEVISVSVGSGMIEGQAVDTYDIFINEVPTPGAVALAGVAGLAGLRRRR